MGQMNGIMPLELHNHQVYYLPGIPKFGKMGLSPKVAVLTETSTVGRGRLSLTLIKGNGFGPGIVGKPKRKKYEMVNN